MGDWPLSSANFSPHLQSVCVVCIDIIGLHRGPIIQSPFTPSNNSEFVIVIVKVYSTFHCDYNTIVSLQSYIDKKWIVYIE
jgi:hypothetical protein